MEIVVGCAALVVAAACSSGDDGAVAEPRLDPDRLISSLSEEELGVLCDWIADLSVGYGQTVECPNGTTLTTDANRETCVAKDRIALMQCSATVRAYEACAREGVRELCDIAGPLQTQECLDVIDCL